MTNYGQVHEGKMKWTSYESHSARTCFPDVEARNIVSVLSTLGKRFQEGKKSTIYFAILIFLMLYFLK